MDQDDWRVKILRLLSQGLLMAAIMIGLYFAWRSTK